MICCKDHEIANEMGMLVNLPREAIEDGVVRNNVITEFFLTNKDDDYQNKTYMGINFCPFCGSGISTELWIAEKK